MKKTIKILALSVFIFIILIVASIVLIPLAIDPNDYKEDIAAFVKEKTGRELVFEGDIGLFVYPWLGLELGRVRLGSAPGFEKETFARVESAKVKIKVLPFLRKQLEVDTFSLQGLEINLKRDKGGRTNWEDLLDAPAAGAPAAGKKDGKKKAGLPEEISLFIAAKLSGINIRDARLVWDDQQNGNYAIINGLALNTSQRALDESFHLNLAFDLYNRRPRLNGHANLSVKITQDTKAQSVFMEKTTLSVQLRDESFPSGKAGISLMLMTDVSLELAKNTLKVTNLNLYALGASLKGNLRVSSFFDNPTFKGNIKVYRFNPRKFMRAMGQSPPKTADPKAWSKASAELEFDGSTRALNMKKLFLRLDDATIKGYVNIKDFAKPEVAFDLTADKIDMDHYLAPKLKKKAKSNKKTLSQRKIAYKDKTGLPFQPLRALEVDGKLRIRRLKVHNVGIRDILMTFTGRKGIIRLHPFNATLHPGKYRRNKNVNALKMNLKGDLRVSRLFDNLAFKGDLKVYRFNPRKFMSAMGQTPPKTIDSKALSKASANFEFDASIRSLNVKKLLIRLDNATIKGKASIKNFVKPEFAFDLRVDKIDVDRYLPPQPTEWGTLKEKTPSRSKAAHKEGGKLPLDPLRALELRGKLRIGKVKAYNLKMKDIRMTITAHKGTIRLHPLKASLYRGKYSGDMIFDVRGKIAKVSTKETLKKIQVGPLLKDLIGEDKLSGTADVSVRITTKGDTDMALRRTLNGKVSFSVTDGRLKGYAIPGAGAKSSSTHKREVSGPAGEETNTYFSEVMGTMWIRKGVARNSDFKFYAGSLKATGKGHLNLVQERLDFLISVEVPVMPTFPIRIHGPFSKPDIDLEVGKMVKGTLKGIRKGVRNIFRKIFK